jgi:nitrite reductase (NO-forming)
MTRKSFSVFLLIIYVLVISGCGSQPAQAMPAAGSSASISSSPVSFSLRTSVSNGKITYMGVGGDIDGVVNPDLVVPAGAVVRVTLINGDGMSHDLYFPDFKVKTPLVSSKGQTAELSFSVAKDQVGTYVYFCTQPGHRQAGQEGRLIVNEP